MAPGVDACPTSSETRVASPEEVSMAISIGEELVRAAPKEVQRLRLVFLLRVLASKGTNRKRQIGHAVAAKSQRPSSRTESYYWVRSDLLLTGKFFNDLWRRAPTKA